MNRVKIVLALGLAFALPAPTAEAILREDAERAIAVARAHWPGSPCEAREHVVWETVESRAEKGHPWHIGGWWDHGTCRVHIIANIGTVLGGWPDLAWLCTGLAHEFGHAAGHGHDEGGVMALPPAAPSRACADAFPPAPEVPLRWRCWQSERATTCADVSDARWRAMKLAAQRRRASRRSGVAR